MKIEKGCLVKRRGISSLDPTSVFGSSVGRVALISKERALVDLDNGRVRVWIEPKFLELYDPEKELSSVRLDLAEKLFWKFDFARKDPNNDQGERMAFKNLIIQVLSDDIDVLKEIIKEI